MPELFPSPDATPFWEACQRRELQLPYCVRCAAFFFYPRTLCPTCGGRDLVWRQVSGRGRLYAFCIQHHSPLPGWRERVPFVTVLVELEEGPRIMSVLTGTEPDPAAIHCEMPLQVAFTELAGGQLLPVFVRAD